jgi:hypothetical protein
MAYIEVRTTLPGHRKTKAAARALRVDRHKLVGHLVALWIWALDNVPSSGSLAGITDVDVEEAAEWPDELAGTLVPALVDAGFVDVEDDGRYLHDWDDYAGRLLKKREADRDRKRQERAAARSPKSPKDVQRIGGDVRRSRPSDTPVGASSTADAPSVDIARPTDTPARPSDTAGKSPRQPAKSRASRAPARGRTAPHRTDTVPVDAETTEAPPARARRANGRRAGASALGIEASDERHPVAAILAGRFRYRDVTEAQWERLAELVDNEFPIGTERGADRRAAWQWLADRLAQLSTDAGDPLEAMFAAYNAELDQRRAEADADERAWAETRARYADEAGPIAAELANHIGSEASRNGHAPRQVSRETTLEMLRSVKGTVPDEQWTRLLARYAVDESELAGA